VAALLYRLPRTVLGRVRLLVRALTQCCAGTAICSPAATRTGPGRNDRPAPGRALRPPSGARADRRLRFRLARYRTALDAGAYAAMVRQWITEVQAEKAVAQAELRDRAGGRRA
jgi:hypothetical protein